MTLDKSERNAETVLERLEVSLLLRQWRSVADQVGTAVASRAGLMLVFGAGKYK